MDGGQGWDIETRSILKTPLRCDTSNETGTGRGSFICGLLTPRRSAARGAVGGARRHLVSAAARARPALPRRLQQRGWRAWPRCCMQRDVVASLLALELAPREEVRTRPQGYSLDAAVMHGGREVAIEVDGPSHFCGRTPTGATALKRRQLRAA